MNGLSALLAWVGESNMAGFVACVCIVSAGHAVGWIGFHCHLQIRRCTCTTAVNGEGRRFSERVSMTGSAATLPSLFGCTLCL